MATAAAASQLLQDARATLRDAVAASISTFSPHDPVSVYECVSLCMHMRVGR